MCPPGWCYEECVSREGTLLQTLAENTAGCTSFLTPGGEGSLASGGELWYPWSVDLSFQAFLWSVCCCLVLPHALTF